MLLVLELQEAKYELQEAKYDFVKGAHNPNQPLPDVRFERVNHHLFGSKIITQLKKPCTVGLHLLFSAKLRILQVSVARYRQDWHFNY